MILRQVLFLCMLCCASLHLRADHLPGGSITYECLGGNTYTVTLTLYRECSGEPLGPQTLDLSNDCGVLFSLTDLLPQSVENISPLCASELPNSTCNGGNLLGFERYTYQQTLFLSPCDAWTISWNICCRPGTINVQGSPGLYLEARLNNMGGLCNNSPYLTAPDLPLVCVGQPVQYDPGVVEVDGHTLVHRFIEARFGTPAPLAVIYNFPYFGLEPFTGMTIDPTTGRINFTPTVQGYIVVAFQVDEFNANGMLIGTVMRDFVFVVRACSSTPPSANSGIVTSVSGAGSADGDRSIRLCNSGESCFRMTFTDPDAGQALSARTNVDLVLPGAAVTTTGTNPMELTICWDATDSPPLDREFTVEVRDDACPVTTAQWYRYRVRVEQAPDTLESGTALACPQTGSFALMDSLGTYPQQPGLWTDPTGAPHPGLFQPATDPGGTYTFTVEFFPGCSTSATVDVTLLAPNDTLCSLVGVGDVERMQWELFPNPTHGVITLRQPRAEAQPAAVVRIHDGQGRQVLERTWPLGSTELVLDLGGVAAPGVYWLQVHSTTGFHAPRRVVVQQ